MRHICFVIDLKSHSYRVGIPDHEYTFYDPHDIRIWMGLFSSQPLIIQGKDRYLFTSKPIGTYRRPILWFSRQRKRGAIFFLSGRPQTMDDSFVKRHLTEWGLVAFLPKFIGELSIFLEFNY